MTDTTIADASDVYLTTMNDMIRAIMGDTFAALEQERLAHREPTRLTEPVYELIASDMMGWSSECDLDEHIAGLREIAARAPKGSRVVIEFERESDYEGGYDTFRRIGFYRPPTPEEKAERKERNAKIVAAKKVAAKRAEEAEREQLERLKAKYEALATAAREGGDVKQAPAESPQSGPTGNAQPLGGDHD